MHTCTMNMFAETNEDMPIISGYALTQAAEMPQVDTAPSVTATERFAEYMKMDRKKILEIAFAHPVHGEWFKAEHEHKTFLDLAINLTTAEYGPDATYKAQRAYWENR